MSSKSWDAAGVAIAISMECSTRILATRQFQSRIDDSVYTLLKIQIDRFGLKKRFAIYHNRIECPETGTDFLFYGRARNIEEIKGTTAVGIHWAEECELMTMEEWRVIDPTLRDDESQHWLIFNPRLVSDFVYKRFVREPPADTIVRKINYNENPFLSQTAIKLIAAAKEEDYDEYLHVYEGEPLTDDDAAIIKRSWVLAAIDANRKLKIEPTGRKRIGFDIADSGQDKCATVYAHGAVVLGCDMWKAAEDELLKSCTRAWKTAQQYGASITYDSIGVGASAGAKFGELNATIVDGKIQYAKFNAGSAVHLPEKFYTEKTKNKDQFLNIKAQAWWMVADRFRNTYNAVMHGHEFDEDEIISLDGNMPNLKLLIDELSTPKREFDNNGKVKVESKKDLAKRDVPSPNCFVAGTLVETRFGSVPIECLQIGDDVVTPMGLAKITHLHMNEAETVISNAGLIGTPDHKIFTWNRGWVPLQMLRKCDKIESLKIGLIKWQILNLLYTKAKCSQFSTRVSIIAQDAIVERTLEMSGFYTGGFGLRKMAQFLMVTTSTISMVIGVITGLKTLNAFLDRSISAFICKSGLSLQNIAKETKKTWMLPGKRLVSGTALTRGGNGTLSMQKGRIDQSGNSLALSAPKSFCLGAQELPKHAQKNALSKMLTIRQNPFANPSANAVVMNSHMQSRELANQNEAAQENVRGPSKGVNVYNITLDRHNVYYANGVLVKNCADALIMAFAPAVEPMVISRSALDEFKNMGRTR